MPDLTRMTKRQSTQFHYMMDVMRRFEWDMHNRIEQSGRIPAEWHDIARSAGRSPSGRSTSGWRRMC